MEVHRKKIRYQTSVVAVFLFLTFFFGGLSKELGIPYITVTHQLLTGFSGFYLLIGLILSVKKLGTRSFVTRINFIAFFMFIIQIGIGYFISRDPMNGWLLGAHYVLSVIIFGLVVSVLSLEYSTDSKDKIQFKLSSSFSKHALLSIVFGILVLVSGVYLSNFGIRESCASWPLCHGGTLPSDANGWIVLIHRFVVGTVGIYLLWFNLQAWRKLRTQKVMLTISNLFVVLFFAQGFIGALQTVNGYPAYMLIIHELTATLFVSLGFILLVLIGEKFSNEFEDIQEEIAPIDWRQRIKDLIALNKPIVVLLLLSTTVAGMIIGGGKLPDADVLIITILGGFLAAGGSSAINQYIDRDSDGKMTRTANRPIPSGRLTPAEGLAFGVTALVVAFYLFAGFINLLAALLALAGMAYYILLYSIYLKKRSVQNIVIGGGAGAIPPLVGWAAATGSLNLAAGFLFFIIFLWTPPHFWALALLRKNEYAAAGIPMMPVKRGEAATRRLIFQYTIALFLTTLVMWFLNLAGWIFLVAAIGLGAYLVILARQVLLNGRNRIYYRMYRHSNYYLLILFVFLAIDSVLL